MSSRLLLVSTVAAALSASPPAAAIVKGHDGGDPAVVALEREAEIICSGTLVGPRTVLTAAHCVHHASNLRIVSGGGRIAVESVRVDPRFDARTLTHDLAVLRLADDARAPFAALPARRLQGLAAVTLVGFGVSAPLGKDEGARREGTATVAQLGEHVFEATPAPAITCRGDSGGAAFADVDGKRTLVGVVSSGDLLCAKRATITRVDDGDDELLHERRGAEGSSAGPLRLGIAAALAAFVAYATRRLASRA